MKHLLIRKVVPVVGVAAVIGGGALFGGDSLPGSDIEREIRSDPSSAQNGLRDVECDDLDAKAGATATCETTVANGATQRLRARVRSVDGSTVNYDVAPVR